MLTIRKIPTLLSMNQDLEQGGCGLDCLGKCCIPGTKLPVYYFGRLPAVERKKKKMEDRDQDEDLSPRSILTADNTFLDTIILAQWEDRMSRGLFRYDVTACETKVLRGNYGFIAQLNKGRHLKKRPTEFRVDQVLQPFDADKFNFTKVGQDEVLFCFEESEDGNSFYHAHTNILESPNVIAINVSPIEYGHVLLVPRVLDCIPQKIDEDTFLLALHMAAEADNPYFRVGYNSLGAFATINHLHFQAYYLAAPFPVERAPSIRVPALTPQNTTVKVSELCDYPVRGLVFELGESLQELSIVVAKYCIKLQECNFPFNVLIADRGGRVYLFPQCFAERQARGEVCQDVLDNQVNPAVWEISGHIVLKHEADYDAASEDFAWKLLAEVSLSEERFRELKTRCIEVAGDLGTPTPVVISSNGFGFPPAEYSRPSRLKQRAQDVSDGRPYGDISLA